MALHFERKEYSDRMERLNKAMAEQKLDCMLLFSQESMYWLTGYDTFGFCFFQCLVVTSEGEMTLLTRAPDLRQAQNTSIIQNIEIWTDRGGFDPTRDLEEILAELDMVGARIGVEYDTQGLTGKSAMLLNARLQTFGELEDASALVPGLRSVKSAAELEYVRKAAELSDFAYDAAIDKTCAGADEGEILAAMHSEIFSRGGDYAGNEFIIGSGSDALLCRYKSGRRKLDAQDQLTLEWSGAAAHYHAAMMRTLVIGTPTARHVELHEAATNALSAVENAMMVGNTFSDMFEAHAGALDDANLMRHRMNACGYSLGAAFTPCWMDPPMIYSGNDTKIEERMVIFAHMIIFDSESNTAMTIGQSFVTRAEGAPQCLSRHDTGLITR